MNFALQLPFMKVELPCRRRRRSRDTRPGARGGARRGSGAQRPFKPGKKGGYKGRERRSAK